MFSHFSEREPHSKLMFLLEALPTKHAMLNLPELSAIYNYVCVSVSFN